jgi:hypothetical protein
MEDEIFIDGIVPWDCEDESCCRTGVLAAKISIQGTWHLLAVSAAAAGPERCPDAVLHTILKDSSDYLDLKGQTLFCEDCVARFAGNAPDAVAPPAAKVLENRTFFPLSKNKFNKCLYNFSLPQLDGWAAGAARLAAVKAKDAVIWQELESKFRPFKAKKAVDSRFSRRRGKNRFSCDDYHDDDGSGDDDQDDFGW